MAVVVMAVGAPPELTACVQSLLAQQGAIEVIVVNSGGGDARARLPAEADHVKLLAFDEILWPGGARNRGIEATDAPFIAFLAADCLAESGWVEARLARHRAGAVAVASSVVNSAPGSIVAWAAHIALFGRRLPATPEDTALKYGASYARSLLFEHGLFREDLRIGEDTDLHRRIGLDRLVWAPEVRTVHRNPTSLPAALRDRYVRGRRSGRYWPQMYAGSAVERYRRFLGYCMAAARTGVTGRERLRTFASLPLIALFGLVFEFGAARGARRPARIARLERAARKAERGNRWEASLSAWKKSEAALPGHLAPLVGQAEALLKLKKFGDADAAFETIRETWPRYPVGHEGVARVAAASRRWRRALEAWAESDACLPGRRAPLLGRATALAEIDRLDDAEAAFGRLGEHFPDDPAAHHGRALIATRKGEWDVAISVYTDLWDRFADGTAVTKLVELLVNLGRLDDARRVAEDPRADDLPIRVRLGVTVACQAARHDWQAIADTLLGQEAAIRRDVSLLGSLVNALAMLGRPLEAVPIIERSLAGSNATRRALQITALLRARRTDLAAPLFKEIWDEGQFNSVSTALFSPMIMAAFNLGGIALAEEVVARVEQNATDGATSAIKKLLVPFHRARLRSLSAIFSGLALPPDTHLEGDVGRCVAAALAQPDPLLDYAVAEETCVTFHGLRARHPAFFPDPAFVLSDALQVTDRIVEAADRALPFSLIRLGDGEGTFLPYRTAFEAYRAGDQSAAQRTWWGQSVARGRQEIEEALQTSIHDADVLGIPNLERVARAMTRRQAAEFRGTGSNARGILAALDFATNLPATVPTPAGDPQLLTSCHIHQALDFWGLWDLLLPRFGTVSLITCRAELGAVLAERHGLIIRRTHLIPAEKKYALADPAPSAEAHFPAVFERLRELLARQSPGAVTLVAAGLLGKIYCHWIKQAGGIAIDIGSAADFWCGHETRSVLESSEHRTPPGLAERYLEMDGCLSISRLVDRRRGDGSLPTARLQGGR
jgi:hypothetical protein